VLDWGKLCHSLILPSVFHFPHLLLEVGPLIQLGGLGSALAPGLILSGG